MTIPENGAEGVLACSGGGFGGWTLFMKASRLHYVHNYLKIEEYAVSSAKPVPPSEHTLSIRFTPAGQNLKPDYFTGDVVLSVDGEPVGELQDIKTGAQYSATTGYGLLVGRNTGTPVSHAYEPPFRFTGQLEKVTIEITGDNK